MGIGRDWRALKARHLKGQSVRAVTEGVRDLRSAVSATPENLKQKSYATIISQEQYPSCFFNKEQGKYDTC
jgi:hypothetical protein